MKTFLQRSMLILPVNVPRFVEKAHLRGADAILLDLEDAVPWSEKEDARGLVKESIILAGKGGADVLVRVNNEPALLDEDLKAAVFPGLHGIFLPKVESGKDVMELEARIESIARDRGIDPGDVQISTHIESPKGLLNLQEIAAAGSKIESMSLGVDDYCLELGIEPTQEAEELFFPFTMLVTVCKAEGIHPIGILGSVAGYQDLEVFERAAVRARNLGAVGAYCIHPNQVPILNKVFSPSQDEVESARRVVTAFEQALQQGRASGSLDGKMIDTPVYKRAKRTLEKSEAIEIKERERKMTE